MISASRSGGTGTILVIALVGIAQNPGSENIRFSPRVFFTIFALILLLPLPAYKIIIDNGLGLKAAPVMEPSTTSNSSLDGSMNAVELVECAALCVSLINKAT